MNVCDFFNGNYMKNEQKYDYESDRTGKNWYRTYSDGLSRFVPIPVFGEGLIYFHIAKSIFESVRIRTNYNNIGPELSQFYISFSSKHKEEVTKLTFPLSDLDMQDSLVSFNSEEIEEIIVIFPTNKLWISAEQPRDGLWDVELSSSENGNWSRYYLGNFYFKKDFAVLNRFVKKRMIRLG